MDVTTTIGNTTGPHANREGRLGAEKDDHDATSGGRPTSPEIHNLITGQPRVRSAHSVHRYSGGHCSSLDRALKQRLDNLALEQHENEESGYQDQDGAGA